jgi:hypothetical protein
MYGGGSTRGQPMQTGLLVCSERQRARRGRRKRKIVRKSTKKRERGGGKYREFQSRQSLD